MNKPVTKEISINELEEAKEMVHKALTPSVPFYEDMEVMKKSRDEERELQLYRLLGWIQTKL